jgi:hypothetical protein
VNNACTLAWRKSSHSTAGNDCVEVAQTGPAYAVRDSKHPKNAHLTFGVIAWKAFMADIKSGRSGK